MKGQWRPLLYSSTLEHKSAIEYPQLNGFKVTYKWCRPVLCRVDTSTTVRKINRIRKFQCRKNFMGATKMNTIKPRHYMAVQFHAYVHNMCKYLEFLSPRAIQTVLTDSSNSFNKNMNSSTRGIFSHCWCVIKATLTHNPLQHVSSVFWYLTLYGKLSVTLRETGTMKNCFPAT